MANSFDKQHCDTCNAVTWHYKGHCSAKHSIEKYAGVVNTMMLMQITKRAPVPPTEAELRRMNRMERKAFRAGDRYKSAGVPVHMGFGGVMTRNDDQHVKDPNKIYCTYCGDEVDEIHLTSGKTKPHIRITNEPATDPITGDIQFRRRVQVMSKELRACPKCCLEIRDPISVQVV